jgi:hypothetical protein
LQIRFEQIFENRKFPQKVIIWLGERSRTGTPLAILDEETVEHTQYMKEVLPAAIQYGNKVLRDD